MKIKVSFDEDLGEVEIIANEAGLKFLVDICLRIVGKTDSSGHWHLSEEMGTLVAGSKKLTICYSEKE